MSGKEDCEDEINANESNISPSPSQTDVEELRKKLKPPDNKKFDRDLEKLNTAIRQKEAKFRSYPKSTRSQGVESNSSSNHVFKDRETLMAELRGYKGEREKEIDMRKKIDQELKGASSLVQSKTEACAKLQAGLKYKTESKVDEAIRRLEHQMRVQQLKLREEKRIVTEIDALRRSKKLIHDFDALKNEIGDLRNKQYLLRSKRDGCMRTITRLKSKEEETKNALDEQRQKADEARHQQKEYHTEKNAFKKEIDELYDRKRALVASFNKEKDEYYNLLRDIKFQERQMKKEIELTTRPEDKNTQRLKQSKDMREQSLAHSSHERMVDLCDTLINYLERMNIDMFTKPVSEDSLSSPEQSQEIQGAVGSFSGGIFLKKKTDDDLEGMYGGISKKQSKRGSKKGRKSTQRENCPKKLVHHPLVLEQFVSLYLTPPSTASDISKTLELLHEKKAILCTVLENPEISSTSLSTSSTENFPSLPSENFPSLPSENSVEQKTLSTTSSTDDSILNESEKDKNKATVSDTQSEEKGDVRDGLQEQENEIEEIHGANEVLVEAENNKSVAIENDFSSQLNENYIPENMEQNDSGNVKEGFDELQESNLDNGVQESIREEREVNDIQNDKENSLKEDTENQVNGEECIKYENNPTKLKQSLEIICDQNNAEYASNDLRNCAPQDGNAKVCSKEVLPHQSSGQDSDIAINCPS